MGDPHSVIGLAKHRERLLKVLPGRTSFVEVQSSSPDQGVTERARASQSPVGCDGLFEPAARSRIDATSALAERTRGDEDGSPQRSRNPTRALDGSTCPPQPLLCVRREPEETESGDGPTQRVV